MNPEILILLIISIAIILIVGLAKLTKQRNTKRENFISGLKIYYPDFREIDGDSLDKTLVFNNGRHNIKVYTQINYLKTRKYTNSYNYFIEISNLDKDDLHLITNKIKSILNINPILKDESILIDVTGIKDFDRLQYFIKNYLNEKVF